MRNVNKSLLLLLILSLAAVLASCTPAGECRHKPAAEWVTVTKATYVSEGREELRCRLCGAVLDSMPIPVRVYDASEVYEGDGEKVIYADAGLAEIPGYVGNGTPEKPYSTLPEAYAAAVAYSRGNGECPVTLYLRNSTFVLSEPLKIRDKLPLKICGNADLKKSATVTTAAEISADAFAQYGNNGGAVKYYVCQLPESAMDAQGNYPAFRDLYLDRKALTLAGTEEGGVFAFDTCAHANGADGPGVAIPSTDHLLYVEPEYADYLEIDEDGYIVNEYGDRTTIELWIRVEWQIHCIRADRVANNRLNLKQGKTTLAALHIIDADWNVFKVDRTYNKTLRGRTYWLRNGLAFLDHDGEFYYDRENGLIYFASDKDISHSVISYPQAEAIFDLSDSQGITVENLNFYGVTENFITEHGFIAGQAGRIKTKVGGSEVGFLDVGAIRGKNVADLTVYGCAISNVGADAVNFRGAVDNVLITNCEITDIGGSAVRFGMANDSYTSSNHNCDITVQNCHIEHIGTIFISNPSIVVTSVKNLTLNNNTILDSAYSAISVGFHWGGYASASASKYDAASFVNVKNAEIAYNYIEDFMMRMSDGGAIYTLGGNATTKQKTYLNTIHDNYIVMDNRIAEGGQGFTGVYHDEGSSHWEDYRNVIVLQAGMHLPIDDYFAQQTANGGTYNNYTRDCFVIGYSFFKEAEKSLPVGRYVFGATANIKATKLVEGRSYIVNGSGSNGAIDAARPNVYAKNVAILWTFDDANASQSDTICEIYDRSGCDFTYKPLEVGEQPVAPTGEE